MKWTRLRCNIVCQIISNRASYFYLYPFENLIQKKIYKKFHKFALLIFFWRNLLIISELKANYE
jgi:hypothetical protein